MGCACGHNHGIRPGVVALLEELDRKIEALSTRAQQMEHEYLALPPELRNEPGTVDGANYCLVQMKETVMGYHREQRELIHIENEFARLGRPQA